MRAHLRNFSCSFFLAVSILGPLAASSVADVGPETSDAQAASTQAASSAHYRGKPLSAVLLDLQARGLAIVFTSELVRPEMQVLDEPVGVTPRQIAEEILQPHELEIRDGPGGVLVIVAASHLRKEEGLIRGSIVDRSNGSAVKNALVRIAETALERKVEEDGSFALAVPGTGRFTLEVKSEGYLDQRVANVSARSAGGRKIVVRLSPQYYMEDEIVVQPSRLSLLLANPNSSFSLGREEIESLPHLGGDIFRMTSLLPGVTAGDVTAAFSVHGGRRDEVRMLLDAQELYGSYHLKDYDNALSIVQARMLAGATLITGAYQADQGDRMSGVFDMRTLDPGSTQHFSLGVSVLDTFASGSGSFAQDRGGWLLGARHGSLAFARNAIGGEHPSYWDLLGKANLSTPVGSFSAHVLLAGDQLVVNKSDGDGFDRFGNHYASFYGWLSHQTMLRDRLLVETNLSSTRSSSRRGGAGDDRQQLGYVLKDHRRLAVLGISQNWILPLGARQLLRWGLEGRRYEAFFDYSTRLTPDFVVVIPFSRNRSFAHQFQGTVRSAHLSGWATDRVSLTERLTAELGLRYDHHSATAETLLSPRINLGYRLGEQGVLRLAWGRFFQSQRPYELQVEDAESVLSKAELSQHTVLGYERFFSHGWKGVSGLRVELFDRLINDPRPRYESLLEPVNVFPETEPDRARVAPDRSRARGVEMMLRGTAGSRFSWWTAYSYSRAQDWIDGDSIARSLDQPHAATVDFHFRLPQKWELNLAWRYRSGWPTTPVHMEMVDDPANPGEKVPAAVFGALNSARFPSYHRLDLRASRVWRVRSSELTFFLDVQNAYNRHNPAGFDLALDPETDRIDLRKEYWPRIVPSLGLAWQF